KILGEIQVLKFIFSAAIFWVRDLNSRNHEALISQRVDKIPISIEFNIVEAFNGSEIFLHKINRAESIDFQAVHSSENTLFKSQSTGKSCIVPIINIAEKVQIVLATGHFKINLCFFERVIAAIKTADLYFHRCIQPN